MASNAPTEIGHSVRTYRPDDFDALYALVGHRMTRRGLQEHLDSPMLRSASDVFVTESAGQLRGVRDVRLTGRGDEAEPIFESWSMLAASAPRAAFDALMQAALHRAREIASERNAHHAMFQTRCAVDDGATRAALEANGLTAARELWTIVRPNLEDIPEPRFPPRIDVRPYRLGDEERWVAAFNEAFADHFGGWMGMPLAVWTRYVASPTFKPDISLVAWDGDQIAGFGHFRIDDELNALRGRRQGVMRYIGVRPAWRRLGLARALTRAGLRGLRAHGMDSCASGVDGTNVTGAHMLYLDEGFHIQGRESLYRASLNE